MKRKNIKWEFIGTFENKSGEMEVMDPFYDNDQKNTWVRQSFSCLSGKYNAYIDVRTKLKKWKDKYGVRHEHEDTRVYSLRIIHQMYEATSQSTCVCSCSPRLFSTSISVTAALCGFFDNKPDYISDMEGRKKSRDKLNPRTWEEFCELVHIQRSAVLAYGAFSDSGWGDGDYPAYVWKGKKGLVVAAELRYL